MRSPTRSAIRQPIRPGGGVPGGRRAGGAWRPQAPRPDRLVPAAVLQLLPDHEPGPAVAGPEFPDQSCRTSCSHSSCCPTTSCRTSCFTPACRTTSCPDQLLPLQLLPFQTPPDHDGGGFEEAISAELNGWPKMSCSPARITPSSVTWSEPRDSSRDPCPATRRPIERTCWGAHRSACRAGRSHLALESRRHAERVRVVGQECLHLVRAHGRVLLEDECHRTGDDAADWLVPLPRK